MDNRLSPTFTTGYNPCMKVLVFNAEPETREILSAALKKESIVFLDSAVSNSALKANPDAEVVCIFVASEFKKEQIDLLPKLRCISTRSTGVDHIDVTYAAGKGISVCNVPKYGEKTVAEFTFALILTLSRRIFDAFYQIREKGDFKTKELEGFDLFGKNLGVVGTGNIGKTVVKIAKGFGMKVLMCDKFPKQELEDQHAKYVQFDELLAESDIVTLHIPYTKENRYLLNKDAFAKMKHGAFVVNTARGELIDTEALLDALKSGRVAGAGLDVLEEERVLKDEIELVKGIESIHELKVLIQDHALIDMPRVVITPHIAFFSREAYHEILNTTATNIANFISGSPSNLVKS